MRDRAVVGMSLVAGTCFDGADEECCPFGYRGSSTFLVLKGKTCCGGWASRVRTCDAGQTCCRKGYSGYENKCCDAGDKTCLSDCPGGVS
mmetsp:Transcript_90535/g.251712  ORF Transcript_90535/g.251712 Transcript_90535/m.251712 type:complete len:90 (+) Transcript_90535:8-277(+)